MDRSFRRPPADGSDGSPPSEAWLFAQAILGNPIPSPATAKTRANREYEEWLAAISPRHAETLRKRQSDEAEARRQRELLAWCASISTECESKLNALLSEQEEQSALLETWQRYSDDYLASIAEWNPDQPRKPPGPGGGQWVATGSADGASGATGRPGRSDKANEAADRAATQEMLELAHAWWQTTGALLNAPFQIKELKSRIASETAQAQGTGTYAHLHLLKVMQLRQELEAVQKLVPQLEKQKRDLEQQYHDAGYDDIPYSSWTTGEMRAGGKGIEQVGWAIGLGPKPASMQLTGIEFDIASFILAAPAILRMGKVVLGKALRKVALPEFPRASLGRATSSNYRRTFFDAHPAQEGRVVVHHAVEQQALKQYPGVVTESELHSLANLRGIPKGSNSETHLRAIRKEWNLFYDKHSIATKEQLLEKATELDNKYGHLFDPPIR